MVPASEDKNNRSNPMAALRSSHPIHKVVAAPCHSSSIPEWRNNPCRTVCIRSKPAVIIIPKWACHHADPFQVILLT